MYESLIYDLRTTLRLTTNAYDRELQHLMEAAVNDLTLAGIDCKGKEDSAVLIRAIFTYCRMNFGSPANYDQLKASYDEQKAQLQMATGYGFHAEEDADV